jgi:hypothetical protein
LFKIAKLNFRGRAKKWFNKLNLAPIDWVELCTWIVQKYGNINVMTSKSSWMSSNKNQRKKFKNIMKGWTSFFKRVGYRMQNNVVDF